MHVGEWTFGNAMCKAYMVSTSITQFTSSIFLFIMSADRYIAVCHPVSSSRFRSTTVARLVTGVAWTASAIIMLPVMLYANAIVKDNKKITCNIEWPMKDNEAGSGTTFTLYSLILGFAIPLSLILCFYYLVIRKLQTVGPKTKSKEKKRSHRKVTKLVLTVITGKVLEIYYRYVLKTHRSYFHQYFFVLCFIYFMKISVCAVLVALLDFSSGFNKFAPRLLQYASRNYIVRVGRMLGVFKFSDESNFVCIFEWQF